LDFSASNGRPWAWALHKSATSGDGLYSTEMTQIQIGLNPIFIWAGGALLWALSVLEGVLVGRKGGRKLREDVRRNFATGCGRQDGWSVFACEAGWSWFDFVSDLSVALSARFPNVALFVLMWVFIGVQVFPYAAIVFLVRPPSGWMFLKPCGPLLEWRHVYGQQVLLPAVSWTGSICQVCSSRVSALILQCWGREGDACARLALGRAAVVLVGSIGGCCSLLFALISGIVFWVIAVVLALLESLFWLIAWVLLVSMWILFRILLFAFGFLLYVTKILPFMHVPTTRFFFWLWTGTEPTADEAVLASERSQRTERMNSNDGLPISPQRMNSGFERARFLQQAQGRAGDDGKLTPAVSELVYQGVNVFTLHFIFIGELVFESVAQGVIQIVVFSFTAWTANAIVSVTLTFGMILFFSCRYIYWLVLRPCRCVDGRPVREQLALMHLSFYGQDADGPPTQPESHRLMYDDEAVS